MRWKRALLLLPLVPVAGLVIMTSLAPPAQSLPSYSNACTGCHGADATVSISASLQSQTATLATFAISGSTAHTNGEGWGAFSAAGAKVASGSGPGSFTVPRDGASYTVYWVDDGSGRAGTASTTVTAQIPTTTTTVRPTTTTTASPTTTSTTVRPTTTTTVSPTTTSTTVRPTTTTTASPTTTSTTIIRPDDEHEDDAYEDDEHEDDEDRGPEHENKDRDKKDKTEKDHLKNKMDKDKDRDEGDHDEDEARFEKFGGFQRWA